MTAPAALLGADVHYPGGSLEGPVTVLATEGLGDHLRRLGPRPPGVGADGDRLLEAVADDGLTGRGGGHFPAARKWQTHLRAGGGGVVVANGAESEPASAKDRALLELRPHLVLDGLASLAQLVGADDVVVWTHAGSHATQAAVRRALDERAAAGLVEPPVRLVSGPDHYLSGESSAIVQALSGGPALPRFRRVSAAESGVGGRPTLVHNVETLARVGLVCRQVHEESTLLTVSSAAGRTVVEAGPRDRLDDVVTRCTGVEPQAVLVGGYGGAWWAWEDLVDRRVDPVALREEGVSLGAGMLLPVADDECGLARAAAIADVMASSSAGQCGPCLFGLRSVADLLRDLVSGDGRRRDLTRLARFVAEITGRGGCHHPDGVVRMVSTAVAVFAADAEAHLRRGRCRHAGRSLARAR